MMLPPSIYCSQLSRDAAEKSYGTASVGDVWLLVEYRRPWGPHALQDSDLSREVKNYLNRILKTVPRSRLLFIKQDPKRREHPRFFIVRSREREPFIVEFALDAYERLLEINVAAVASGQSLEGGSLMKGALFLVCTHGKRDKCCAKFGYPLYKSLSEQTALPLWQSSHVGGDRFAANLICFPHGIFYAHVTGEGGRRIIDEYEGRRLVLDEYRGRVCYSYPVQAAEFFIRRESGIVLIDGLRQLDCERLSERRWRARFISTNDGRVHEAEVASRPSDFQTYITCHSDEEKRVVQYLLNSYSVSGEANSS
jgi:hypothetical protein